MCHLLPVPQHIHVEGTRRRRREYESRGIELAKRPVAAAVVDNDTAVPPLVLKPRHDRRAPRHRAGHIFTTRVVTLEQELRATLELRSASSRCLVVGHVDALEDRAPVVATVGNNSSGDVQSRAEQDVAVHLTTLLASTLPMTCSMLFL
jgi:hypothetical protein